MARLLARLVVMNDGWARPFGDFNHRWLSALFRPMPAVRDLLNGRWLGHPLHAALTDLPIGLLLGVVALDVLGQPGAADIALVLVVLTMVAAAVTGAADYSDTDGTARTRATLHATLMVVALLLLLVSLGLRAGGSSDRTIPVGLDLVAFLIVSAGAFVGGDVVYVLGNMVSRHAFRGAGRSGSAWTSDPCRTFRRCPRRHPPSSRPGSTTWSSSGSATRSMRCTPSAPTRAGPWRRGRSWTAASSVPGTGPGIASRTAT